MCLMLLRKVLSTPGTWIAAGGALFLVSAFLPWVSAGATPALDRPPAFFLIVMVILGCRVALTGWSVSRASTGAVGWNIVLWVGVALLTVGLVAGFYFVTAQPGAPIRPAIGFIVAAVGLGTLLFGGLLFAARLRGVAAGTRTPPLE